MALANRNQVLWFNTVLFYNKAKSPTRLSDIQWWWGYGENDGYSTVFNGMQTRDRLLERQSENIYWVLKNSCNFPGAYAKETFRNIKQCVDDVHHSLTPVKKGGKPTGLEKLILAQQAYDIIWSNL